MQVYIDDILTGLIVFPLVACVFAVPYSIVQYRRFGAMPLLRVGIVYSMILYLICAYFTVILPLPSREAVAAAEAVRPQLVPFAFIRAIMAESGLVLSDIKTYLPALRHASVYTVFFNLLLTLPLGVYARYYFRARWWGALAAGFGLSLFFELSQLTGLYGIYAKAYRLFDVDDLIVNTLGAMCGFWLSPLLEKLLPTRDRLDELSYQKGRRVTLTRRLAACMLDWFLIAACAVALMYIARLSGIEALSPLQHIHAMPTYFIGALCAFVLIPLFTGGATFGKWLVGVRLRGKEGGAPKWYQLLIRYGALYGVVFAMPCWLFLLLKLSRNGDVLSLLALSVGAATGVMVGILFIIRFFATALKKENRFLYERLSGVKNVSVVKAPRRRRQAKQAA